MTLLGLFPPLQKPTVRWWGGRAERDTLLMEEHQCLITSAAADSAGGSETSVEDFLVLGRLESLPSLRKTQSSALLWGSGCMVAQILC